MCGKFVQMVLWDRITEPEAFAFSIGSGLTEAVTPMRFASVIRKGADGKREAARMRWGFVPASAREATVGTQFIHARSETIEQKRTFRDAFFHRRGLVVVRSFNEGKEITPTKTEQHVITDRDGKPIAIAVIWERWANAPPTMPLETFAMVTTPANTLIGAITDRMPAVIAEKDWPLWLGEEPASVSALKAILKPYEGNWDMEVALRAKRPAPKPSPKPPPRNASSDQQELF